MRAPLGNPELSVRHQDAAACLQASSCHVGMASSAAAWHHEHLRGHAAFVVGVRCGRENRSDTKKHGRCGNEPPPGLELR